jgi:CMP-N-acetylneuraminic acid synthetase
VWWKEVLKKKKSLYLKGSKIYVMPKERSVDIDDKTDFKLAKMLMEEKQACVS